MAVITSNPMNVDNSLEKVSISIDPYDYYDQTNKRPKSGAFKVSITAVTWTADVAGETLKVTIHPPNYHKHHDNELKSEVLLTAHGLGALTYEENVAWNYGVPGPSANAEPDGQCTLLDIELEAQLGTAVVNLIVTVTYTVTFTEYSPYSNITPSTVYHPILELTDKRDRDIGIMTKSGLATNANGAVIVQVQGANIVSFDNNIKDDAAPTFMVTVNPIINNVIRLVNHSLSKVSKKVITYRDNYTWVFAVNNGKIDANSQRLVMPDVLAYNLLNYALLKVQDSDDTVTLDLTLALKTDVLP